MAVVPEGGPDGITPTSVVGAGDEKHHHHDDAPHSETGPQSPTAASEKNAVDVDISSDRSRGHDDSDVDEYAKHYTPDDSEEWIDPRLANYPVPLVAKTVDLHNDFK